MDVIDLLGVPVQAWCTGQAVGPALGVLAVCDHRTVSPHAQLRLFEPSLSVRGNARQVEQLAAAHLDQWSSFCARLALATGQPLDCVRDDAARGRYLSGPDAIEYGLADELATPEARLYRLPGRPIGFGRR
jgi:ATP-dependent Clp protease protease subunit